MEEIELSSPFVVRAFRVGGYLLCVAIAVLVPLVVLKPGQIGSLQGLTEASPSALGVSAFFVLLGLYGVAQNRRLRHAVASPDGVRSDGQFVPWSQIKRLAVSNGRTVIRHEGGTIRSLLLMPRPVGDYSAPRADYFDRVIAWWRASAEVEKVWRPLGHLYKATSRGASSPAV